MRNKKKNIISLIVLVILIFITFFFLLKDINLHDLLDTVKNAKKLYILLAFFMVFLYLFIGGYYLKLILESLHIKAKLWKCFIYSSVEHYFDAITPLSLGGEPAKIYYMTKDGIPVMSSSIAIIFIMAVYKVAILLMGTFFMIYKPSIIFNNGWLFTTGFIFGFLVILFMGIFLFTVMFSPTLASNIVNKLVGLGAKLKLVKDKEKVIDNFSKHLEDYKIASAHLKKNKLLFFQVLILTILQRTAMFAISYYVYRALGLSTATATNFILIQTIMNIVGDGLPFPGGVGVAEIMFLNLYRKFYTKSKLMPAMVLTRGINHYFALLVTASISLFNHARILSRENKLEKEIKLT